MLWWRPGLRSEGSERVSWSSWDDVWEVERASIERVWTCGVKAVGPDTLDGLHGYQVLRNI